MKIVKEAVSITNIGIVILIHIMKLVSINKYKKKKIIKRYKFIIYALIPVFSIIGYFSLNIYHKEQCCNKICKDGTLNGKVVTCHSDYVWCQWDSSVVAYQLEVKLSEDMKKWSAENGNVLHEPCNE